METYRINRAHRKRIWCSLRYDSYFPFIQSEWNVSQRLRYDSHIDYISICGHRFLFLILRGKGVLNCTCIFTGIDSVGNASLTFWHIKASSDLDSMRNTSSGVNLNFSVPTLALICKEICLWSWLVSNIKSTFPRKFSIPDEGSPASERRVISNVKVEAPFLVLLDDFTRQDCTIDSAALIGTMESLIV